MLTGFDHVNVRTANLEAMITWYDTVLGLSSGKRPPFSFPGAWLYLGERAVVHLVGVDHPPQAGGDITLEHFSFRAKGMAEFTARLERHNVPYVAKPVPGIALTQINLHDPDGNHIHVDFDTSQDSP